MESTTEQGNGAMVKVETAGLVPITPKGVLTKQMLEAEREQRMLLAEFIHHNMVEGVDYGVIPGTERKDPKTGKETATKVLLKPGAEKLVDLFRTTPKFALIKSEENFETGLFNYVFRVRLYQRDAEAVVAEGFGSCNSREGRYRWRDGKRKCLECGFELRKSKNSDEWYCWEKKGGCGATYPLTDPRVVDQQVGRVENDDIASLANTVLKMAKKRALVDGAIALARCSDLFTQDLDDDEPTSPPTGRYTPHAPEQGKRSVPTQASAKTASEPKTATEKPRRMPIQDETAKPPATPPPAKATPEAIAARHALRASSIYKRYVALGNEKERFQAWCLWALQGINKPSREWTDADMKALEDELATAEKARGTVEESDAF